MILHPDQARATAKGVKTMLRLPVKPSHHKCPQTIGHTYAIQTQAFKTPENPHPPVRPTTHRIEIVATWNELLGDLTFEHARAEGFKTRQEFYDHWALTHGTVNAVLPVWVIVFKTAHDEPRLLRSKPAREGTPDGDYTHQTFDAMRDEPEAIDTATQAKLTEQAHTRRRLGYNRVTEIQGELDSIQASIDRLAARNDLGRESAKRLREMRRARELLLRNLAA